MTKKQIFFTVALSFLMISSEARGQFKWMVTHTDEDWRYDYRFQSVSCFGDNCTAAGILTDHLRFTDILMFWRSIDGGSTWRMQDPKLSELDGNHNNILTRIQQIDSLNIVAIGNYGLMFRTFDGGNSWEKQDCGTINNLSEVHFSDPLTGILTTTDSIRAILTTSDGGKHWNTIPIHFLQTNFSQCHSFGNGKFSLLAMGLGPIWSTKDNWKTIQSSNSLIDHTSDTNSSSYYFTDCVFGGSDTIIAYGGYYNQGQYAAIVRTTDGGAHWEKPFTGNVSNTNQFDKIIYTITNMSPIHRDTILAASFGISKTLMSTNDGETWRTDTIATDTNYNTIVCTGLGWGKNVPLAIYNTGGGTSVTSIIIKGKLPVLTGVSEITRDRMASIFPNPASTSVRIYSGMSSKIVSVYDILGREVLQGLCSTEGDAIFDVRKLNNGMYNVYGEENGKRRYIGKFIIEGK
jgi:photosystem II stability/assembly factor-like uncharacterized protein